MERVKLFILICWFLLSRGIQLALVLPLSSVPVISPGFPLSRLQVGKCKVSSGGVIMKCKAAEANDGSATAVVCSYLLLPHSCGSPFRNLFCGQTQHIYMPPLAGFNWLLLKGELGVSASEDWECWQHSVV